MPGPASAGPVAEAAPDPAAILAEARAVKAAAEAEGRREGQRLGEQQGFAEGLRRGSEEARRVIEEARAEAEDLRRAAIDGVGQLACEIASQLLGAAMHLDPEVVTEHVARVLAESQPLGVLEIRVHPRDLKAAREAKLRWQAELAGEVEVAIVPDPELPPGACRVQTRSGDIEWIWPERLAEIDRAMGEVSRRFGLDA
jgi:flagellar biosynthesis/type III secretory pathway protein FliH